MRSERECDEIRSPKDRNRGYETCHGLSVPSLIHAWDTMGRNMIGDVRFVDQRQKGMHSESELNAPTVPIAPTALTAHTLDLMPVPQGYFKLTQCREHWEVLGTPDVRARHLSTGELQLRSRYLSRQQVSQLRLQVSG